MSYYPEQTIGYKTYCKRALVEALGDVFKNHIDSLLNNTRVTVEYPKTEVDYPTVVVRMFERDISNAGVGHEEYLRQDGETAPTDQLSVNVPPQGSVQLSWDSVANAFRYHVYRIDSTGRATFFVTNSTQFIDMGLHLGSDGRAPEFSTSGSDSPDEARAVVGSSGELSPGEYIYQVTALTPGEVWKFKHYFYHADIEFAVYALSSLDRDLIADTIVQTLTMGALEPYTNRFFERIFPDPESDLFPGGDLHYITLNTDQVQGFGENEARTDWGAEDDLIYTTSYRVSLFGELYSLPPNIPYALVAKVFLYPYIGGVEAVPTGSPNDDGVWIP